MPTLPSGHHGTKRPPSAAQDPKPRQHEPKRRLHEFLARPRASAAAATVTQRDPRGDDSVERPVARLRQRHPRLRAERFDQMGTERDLTEIEDDGDHYESDERREDSGDDDTVVLMLLLDEEKPAAGHHAGHRCHHEHPGPDRDPDDPQGAVAKPRPGQHRGGNEPGTERQGRTPKARPPEAGIERETTEPGFLGKCLQPIRLGI